MFVSLFWLFLLFSLCFAVRVRWCAPADRNRLTHVNEEDSGVVVGEEDNGVGVGDDGGKVPPGAMPTGVLLNAL